MLIRDYNPQDLPSLARIHEAHGFEHPFPQIEIRLAGGREVPNPLFVAKKVLVDAAGVEIAAVARKTVEIYLLADPQVGRPETRWAKFQALHRAMETELWNQGYEDMHAWLPASFVRPFGRRLEQLNWTRDDVYTPFVKYLVPDRGPQVEDPDGSR